MNLAMVSEQSTYNQLVMGFFVTAGRFLATASAAGTTTLSIIPLNESTCSSLLFSSGLVPL